MWNELRRKFFHLGALVYVVGLVFVPRPTYLVCLVSGTFVVGLIETARLRSPAFGAVVSKLFGSLMRSKEEQRFSGLFWMLAGVTLTVSLVKDVPVAATAILYLILGDAMASLVGMRWQGPFWPGQQKRIGGSVACWLTCLLIGFVLLRPHYGWHGVILGATTATFIEVGFARLDDNVTIPVASALVLMLCYGLTPGF